MHQGKYVFAQIMEEMKRYRFQECVTRYRGEHRVKQFSCWEQFLAMAFGQLTFRKSLRDIVVCLNAHQGHLYHLGFRSPVHRSTLSDANERRSWMIYRDIALSLIHEARSLYQHDLIPTLPIDEAIYVIDATTIDLCLPLFPWARVPHDHASLKLNLGIELHGNIPAFFSFSGGTTPDLLFLDDLVYEAKAFYVIDRGYVDFRRFFKIHLAGAFFVTRAKIGWSFRRLYSNKVPNNSGIMCDQIGVEGRHHQTRKFSAKLRRIKYYDVTKHKRYIFMTNNLELPAATIVELYKQRWQIELFFKWMKQHLAIESFWGRTANAVKTQICIAMSAYLLVMILKKRLRIERDPYEILQIVSVFIFQKTPISSLMSRSLPQSFDKTEQMQQKSLGI